MNIRKVGVGIIIDVQHLQRGFGVYTKGRIDLCNITPQQRLRLKQMAEDYLGVELFDIDTLAIEWTHRPLSRNVLIYSAEDAIAGLKIYEHFSKSGDRFDRYVDKNYPAQA